MLKKLLFVILFCCTPCLAETYLFVEHYTTVQSQGATPQFNFYFERDFTRQSQFGIYSWSQTGKGYHEIYGGLTFRPVRWIKAGIGGGVDSTPTKGLFNISLCGMKKGYTFFGTYTKGPTTEWHQALINKSLNKRFGVGVMTQRWLGVGPRGETKIGPMKVWGSAFFRTGQQNYIAGIRYEFFRE